MGWVATESRGCLTELIDMIISHYFIVSYLFHHSKIKGSLRSCGKPQALLWSLMIAPPPSPLFSFFRSLSFFLLPGTSLQASNSSRPRRCLPMIKDLYCVCAQRKLQQLLSLPNLINSLAWPFNDWYTPRPRPHTPSISLFPIFSLFPSVCSARIHEHILTAFR